MAYLYGKLVPGLCVLPLGRIEGERHRPDHLQPVCGVASDRNLARGELDLYRLGALALPVDYL